MEMKEFHWLMDMMTHINVGLAAFDRNGKVFVWNQFMENHSGISSTEIKEVDSLFTLFPSFQSDWVQAKLDAVEVLGSEVFIPWEHLPHFFDFASFRPFTGESDRMYQNISFGSIRQANGKAELIAMMVYDVTDIATSKLALQKANQELETLSRTDRLTGLFNRGFWQEQLHHHFAHYQRHHNDISLIMFDIDHFKKVNDTYGHGVGDDAICLVADIARSVCREIDIVGRYGGEEYTILLPSTDAEGGKHLAERIRTAVESSVIKTSQGSLSITISLGVAQLTKAYAREADWLEAADQALYRAKESGRNNSQLAS